MEIEAKKTKKTNRLINAEIKRLSILFIDLEENKKSTSLKLIENAAFMSVTLDDLKDHIKKHGIKEKYQNGNSQYGYKESIEAKNYNTIVKNYMNIMKQLNDMLPQGKRGDLEDEFDKFSDAI